MSKSDIWMMNDFYREIEEMLAETEPWPQTKKLSYEEENSSLGRFRGVGSSWCHARDYRRAVRNEDAFDRILSGRPIVVFEGAPDLYAGIAPSRPKSLSHIDYINQASIWDYKFQFGSSISWGHPGMGKSSCGTRMPMSFSPKWEWDWPTGRKAWKPLKSGQYVLYYHPRTHKMPTRKSHPYGVVILDPTATYESIRQYCKEDLGLLFNDAHVSRRTVVVSFGVQRNEGFLVQFKDHVPAVQFKLTWDGVDDDTNSTIAP